MEKKEKNVELIAGWWTLSGEVGPFSQDRRCKWTLEERIQAAADAGYAGIGFGHLDLMHQIEQSGIAKIKSCLASSGLKYVELEVLLDWFADGERRVASDKVRSDLLMVAAEIGARHIKVAGDRSKDAIWPEDRLFDSFYGLCEDASKVGAKVGIEFQPWSSIHNIEKALSVINGAGHPAGGIYIDIWHVQRENIDLKTLEKLRADQIVGVELCDALNEQVGGLWEDTADRRRLCGDGEFPIQELLQIESPRVLRRLNTLRGLSHDEVKQVFTRGP